MSGVPITPFELTTVTTAAATDHLMIFRNGAEEDITLEDLLIASRVVADANLTTVRFATLDASGILNVGQLPAGYDDSAPIGPWLIDNTSPVLSDSGGSQGDKYRVDQTGTISQGAGTLAINGQSVQQGDLIVKGASTWYIVSKVANFADGTTSEDSAATKLDYKRTKDVVDLALSGMPSNAACYDGKRALSSLAADALHSFVGPEGDLPLTIAADVAPERVSGNGLDGFVIAGKWGSTTATQEYRLIINQSGFARLELSDVSGDVCGLAYDVSEFLGKRFHIVVSYSGKTAFPNSHGDVQMWINGKEVTGDAIQVTNASYSGMSVTAAPFNVGGISGTTNFALGKIYSVLLLPRVVRSDEALELSLTRNRPSFSARFGDRTNRVTNGTFDAWTGSVPDGWTVGANATVSEETTTVQSGSAMRLVAGGSIVHHRQPGLPRRGDS